MVLSFFFKDIIWIASIFIYQFFCGFSSQIIYDYSYTLFYNVFFTSLPVLIVGMFDQDISAHSAIKYPELYRSGINRSSFTYTRFSLFMFEGLYQSAMCFILCYYAFIEPSQYNDGKIADRIAYGTTLAFMAIINANMFVSINLNLWSYFSASSKLTVDEASYFAF